MAGGLDSRSHWSRPRQWSRPQQRLAGGHADIGRERRNALQTWRDVWHPQATGRDSSSAKTATALPACVHDHRLPRVDRQCGADCVRVWPTLCACERVTYFLAATPLLPPPQRVPQHLAARPRSDTSSARLADCTSLPSGACVHRQELYSSLQCCRQSFPLTCRTRWTSTCLPSG